MKRETKFNYGFLFVSLGVPFIADYYLGRKSAVIAAIFVTALGMVFLVAAHQHRERDDSPPIGSRWRRAFVFAFISLVLGGAAILIGTVIRPHRGGETVVSGNPQEVAVPNPKPPLTQAPTPNRPTPSTTRPRTRTHSKKSVAQENSVYVENGAKIEQKSSGDCSPNVVGGANTFNCGPPSPKISWEPTEYVQPAGAGRPVVWAKMYLDSPFNNPQFAVSCNRPCIGTNMGGLPMGAFQPYYRNKTDTVVIFSMDPPNPLPGDRTYFWGVQSKDDLPVRITDVQIMVSPKIK